MSHFSKERLDEMDDYQTIRDARLTEEEQAAIDLEVEQELASLVTVSCARCGVDVRVHEDDSDEAYCAEHAAAIEAEYQEILQEAKK